jgi:hypothetical protein
MKSIEIEGDTISFYYVDEEGGTHPLPMSQEDREAIAYALTVRFDERGKMLSIRNIDGKRTEMTLHWSVVY